ncbi:MAG: hypothetical protein HOK29_11725 [Candidatus Marinimicrobia bacterium]|nr:hypothetical protein [Candidatus Neomarinimicrobiota bacterium]
MKQDMMKNLFITLAISISFMACSDDSNTITEIPGCTNPEALNFDENATVDDGSCEFAQVITGCTDPDAINYNPNATVDDGSCNYDQNEIPGCTDPLADNYNSEATIDNGSCIYTIFGCTDPGAINYNLAATIDDGSCEYAPANSCWDVDPAQFEYNGSITARVEIDGLPVGSEEDCIAAFVGEEVRGVVNGLYFPPDDIYLFMITVYSNSSSGDVLNFKYYSVENDEMYNLNEEVEFQVNMFVGDPLDPFIITGSPNVGSYFSWNQSSLQAFYFIQATTIEGIDITTDDWIAVFKNDVCTGAAQWTGEYTVVPSMGDDGFNLSDNYMLSGDIPQFKVYDSSENTYYDAITNDTSQNIGWVNLSNINIALLIAE